jgi:hypothetical protein
MELVFERKPSGLQASSYKVFKNENPKGTVVFNVETKIVQRYITLGCTYKDLVIERTDFFFIYGGELFERKVCSEPSAGPCQSLGQDPPHRYSAFPRGKYVVSANQKVHKVSVTSHGYTNVSGKLVGKSTRKA